MKTHWAEAIVQELRQVDREEAPHGLYGLRQSRQVGARLPNLAHLLVAPPIRLLKRAGVSQRSDSISAEYFSFGAEGPRNVLVDIETHADTKVREFGDTFRLDKRSRPTGRPAPDLQRNLTVLSKRLQENHGRETYSFGLLFIGHFAKRKDLLALVQPVTAPEFLERHALLHCGEVDGYGRDFWSAIQLWYVEQPPKG